MENSLLKIILNFFSCLFIFIKISKRQTLFTQKKIGLVFKKVFFLILGIKHFLEIIENLEISYYLLIISNLVLNILIIIYFVLIFFQFHPLEFGFI
jgi:hypothetical protein